jgi:hypothetical protein
MEAELEREGSLAEVRTKEFLPETNKPFLT